MIRMEKVEKFFILTEQSAEELITKRKESTEGDLIDYKVSEKETKNGIYYIVTLKTRFKTLQECKDSMF